MIFLITTIHNAKYRWDNVKQHLQRVFGDSDDDDLDSTNEESCKYHMKLFGKNDDRTKKFCGSNINESLKGRQKRLDKNKNNKIDAEDFKHLRAGKKPADVKKEEVENIGEASTYKLGRAAAETKNFPIHHNGEHVGTLEFHTSAGKLHHQIGRAHV